jgi:hypothetical protein
MLITGILLLRRKNRLLLKGDFHVSAAGTRNFGSTSLVLFRAADRLLWFFVTRLAHGQPSVSGGGVRNCPIRTCGARSAVKPVRRPGADDVRALATFAHASPREKIAVGLRPYLFFIPLQIDRLLVTPS